MNKAITNLQTAHRSWVEHRGGLVLSLFLHLLLFSILLTKVPLRPQTSPMPRRVFLHISVPPSIPVRPNAARATFVKSSTESPRPPARETAPKPQRTVGSKAFQSTSRDNLAEINREVESEEREIARSLTNIRGELERRAFRLKGVAADFSSEGADKGTIRILDFEDHPDNVVAPILKKYGIRITQKYINGKNEMMFLNRARLGDKTFISQNQTGYFEVFELSSKALKKLTLLEEAELAGRGLDPNNTRIIKIVFGVVRRDGEYDLAVTDFKYQELY